MAVQKDAGKLKSGSKGTSGPSTPKSACASNMGPARLKGGAKSCGFTGTNTAREQKSGSRGG